MKTGITLHEMATKLAATQEAKADYVGSTEKLYARPDGKIEIDGVLNENFDGAQGFDVTNHAKRQIEQWAGLPAGYADKCPSELWAINVNHWLKSTPANRMLRTLNPNPYLGITNPTLRAFLSDLFRIVDNYDYFEAIYPKIQKHADEGNLKIDSINVTPRKFYFKAHLENVDEVILKPEHTIGEGHNHYFRVRPAIEFGNGEIGGAAISVALGVYDDSCTNLAVFRSNAFKRNHIGKAQADTEMWKLLSTSTQELSNKALLAQIADYAEAGLDRTSELFNDTCNLCREKLGLEVKRPEATMQLVTEQFNLSQAEGEGVLAALLQRGDMSVFGIQAAVTQHSQEVEDYDRASELEEIGGQILELPAQRWTTILKQAEELKLKAA